MPAPPAVINRRQGPDMHSSIGEGSWCPFPIRVYARAVPEIRSGFVNACYLFDVAQAIDLGALRKTLGAQATTAKLDDKGPGPPRLRYTQPPVIVTGDALGCAELGGFKVRVKFYDYGVVSLMLSQAFAGSWSDLAALGQTLIESESLEQLAADASRRFVDQTRDTMTTIRASFLSEDYLVFAVTGLEGPLVADEVIARHGADIAQLLRGERQPLSQQERDEVLRHRLSYLAEDLVVPAWNAAFVADNDAAALATVEILELANSQLLEFRFYDDLLETELTGLYAELQRSRWADRMAWRRHSKATRRVQSLVIDVTELTDRMENAVELVGDIYAARLFSLAGARLGLDHWKRSVEDKLKTLDDIHRFAVDQTGAAQGNIMELAILLILVVELWLAFAGLMK
jgi:hypothetical protein